MRWTSMTFKLGQRMRVEEEEEGVDVERVISVDFEGEDTSAVVLVPISGCVGVESKSAMDVDVEVTIDDDVEGGGTSEVVVESVPSMSEGSGTVVILIRNLLTTASLNFG
jgi:hypothetical protein